jgi:hypothetical protein
MILALPDDTGRLDLENDRSGFVISVVSEILKRLMLQTACRVATDETSPT